MTTALRDEHARDASDLALDRRLDAVGWGLFLIMTGAIWLVPDTQLPQGIWLIGTGVLLLAINAVKRAKGLAAAPFMVFLGVVALAAGLADLVGLQLPLIAICFIAIGVGILLRVFMPRAA